MKAVNLLEEEGFLNKYLFDEKDIMKIKAEIMDILLSNKSQDSLNSIWMNYSGATSVGGPTKASEIYNLGLKDPVLHYISKEDIIPEVTNLVEPSPMSKRAKSKTKKKLV